jgi:YVTN family beta-propeller protein
MIWVANAGGNSISVINPSTMSVVSTITGIQTVSEMAYDGNYVWAASVAAGVPYAVKINAQTYSIIMSVNLGGVATDAYFISYDGAHIWVNCPNTPQTVIIDPVANAILANYNFMIDPYQMVLYNGFMWMVSRSGGNAAKSIQVGSPISASLSYSTDGGHTWSIPVLQSLGAWASYLTRVIWYRLGVGRQWAFNFTLSGSHKKVLLSGVVDYKEGRF